MSTHRSSSRVITRIQIDTAKAAIFERFRLQCANGRQTQDLPDTYAACGQFVGEMQHPQRGLHGCAAAVRVLAGSASPAARGVVQRLAEYMAHFESVEVAVAPDQEKPEARRKSQRENQNVIKLSEILFGLSFVPTGEAATEALKSSIAQRLIDGLVEGKGWTYFLDESGPAKPLPTAHALRALHANGYQDFDPKPGERFLVETIESASSVHASRSVQVFCLFVLTRLEYGSTKDGKKFLREQCLRLWRQLEPLLGHDSESNIEYSRGGRNFYVRVPWQLYLLAVAAFVRPVRCFQSSLAQRRLVSVCVAAESPGGFFYPQSGEKASSRTNAILFDILDLIGPTLDAMRFRRVTVSIDSIRLLLGSRIVTVVSAFGALIVAAVAVYSWWESSSRSVGDLAPELLGPVVLFALSARKIQL